MATTEIFNSDFLASSKSNLVLTGNGAGWGGEGGGGQRYTPRTFDHFKPEVDRVHGERFPLEHGVVPARQVGI